MKPASALFQIAALAACLSASLHVAGGVEMPGMRRAIQAIAEAGGQKAGGPMLAAPSASDR